MSAAHQVLPMDEAEFREAIWSTFEICWASGVTPRRIQHAEERGHLRSRIEHHRRNFSLEESARAVLVFALVDGGIPLNKAASIVRKISVNEVWCNPDVLIVWVPQRGRRVPMSTLKLFKPSECAAAVQFAVSAKSGVLCACPAKAIERLKQIKTMDRVSYRNAISEIDPYRRYRDW